MSTQNKICLALLSLCFLVFSFFCLFAPFFFFSFVLHIPLFIWPNSVPSRLTTTKGDLLNSVLQILLHEMSFPCRLIPCIYFKVASSQRYMWLRSCKDAALCELFLNDPGLNAYHWNVVETFSIEYREWSGIALAFFHYVIVPEISRQLFPEPIKCKT